MVLKYNVDEIQKIVNSILDTLNRLHFDEAGLL